jgi:hypothetical protein
MNKLLSLTDAALLSAGFSANHRAFATRPQQQHRRKLGVVAAAALALAGFSFFVSAPANARCSVSITGQWICEDAPSPTAAPPADSTNCENTFYNTCPYCKIVPQTFPPTPQPVLPCDHSRYE